jgi:hypothetical protein
VENTDGDKELRTEDEQRGSLSRLTVVKIVELASEESEAAGVA